MIENRLELARTLGARLKIVRQPDDEKAFADAILDQLMRDRLLWVVADEAGRPGASIADVARITFHIARLSGSAGLIYAMHMSQALTLVRHAGDNPFLQDLLGRMIRDQVLVASGTSEKGVGGDIFGSLCAIEPTADGRLVVAKESPNISYLDRAGLILLTAMRPNPGGKDSQLLVAVEASALEVEPGRSTGFLGMRGILNRPYALKATFSEAAIFPDAYPTIARDTMTPSVHIFWAALWSGLASVALDKTKTALASATGDREMVDLMRVELSGLVDKHYEMNALIRNAIADYEASASAEGMGLAHTARVKRLKVVCSDLLTEICVGALGLLGLRGYAEGGSASLSEIIRDALSARVMISNYRLSSSNAKIERYLEELL